MRIEDHDLPAAAHLTGEGAFDVLRVPIEAAGGELLEARPCHVQFRPGADLIVRYSASVSWNGAPGTSETLVAASTVAGPHRGAVQVTAGDGASAMTIGVWRWPFDPVLTGLTKAVTPKSAAEMVGIETGDVVLKVVAFRPTERAVVKVVAGRAEFYLKVVSPASVERLVARQSCLREAGVPVAEIREVRADDGIMVLESLRGRTLRDDVKSGRGTWPAACEFDRLAACFADTEVPGAPPVASRITDGVLHATMLATVLPEERERLTRLSEVFEATISPPDDTTIHGDLHEGQLIVADGRISGVLDIDDAGPGSRIADRASLLGHLTYRAMTVPQHRSRIAGYADGLRSASGATFDLDALDRTTAAVLVGLATGPFRIQQAGWRTTVQRILAEAERLVRNQPGAAAEHSLCTAGAH